MVFKDLCNKDYIKIKMFVDDYMGMIRYCGCGGLRAFRMCVCLRVLLNARETLNHM